MKMIGAAILSFLASGFPASAQSVVATHSGVVYFFEGSVFLGDQPLELCREYLPFRLRAVRRFLT